MSDKIKKHKVFIGISLIIFAICFCTGIFIFNDIWAIICGGVHK